MSIMSKSILLYSGGIDSFVALSYIRDNIDSNVIPVYYDLMHKYNEPELDIVTKNKKCKVVEYSPLGDLETDTAYIPNRNLILAMDASGRFNADVIYIGGTKSDRISDNNREIMDKLSDVVTTSMGKKITITSPFWDVYKEDIAKWYCGRYNGINLLLKTFSCYEPYRHDLSSEYIRTCNHKKDQIKKYNTKECNACQACFRKSVILNTLGIIRNFDNEKIVNKYKNEFSKLIPNTRIESTLRYISTLDTIYGTEN